jgi:hypothetical protein
MKRLRQTMKILPKANLDAEEADAVAIKVIVAAIKVSEEAIKVSEAAIKVSAAAIKVREAAIKVKEAAIKVRKAAIKVSAVAIKMSETATKASVEGIKETNYKLYNTQTRTSRIARDLRRNRTTINPTIKEAEVIVQTLVVEMAYQRALYLQKLAWTRNKYRRLTTGVADEEEVKKVDMPAMKANKEMATNNPKVTMTAKEAVTEDSEVAKEALMLVKLQEEDRNAAGE